MALPTLVLAPGAWYPMNAFDKLIAELEPEGYKCIVIEFPSVSYSPPVTTLDADIAAVRNAVTPEVESGKEVIIVAHSWAGVPVNSALEGLSKAEREKEGKKGGVVRLCFIAAFLLEEGVSLVSAFGGNAPWYIIDHETNIVKPDDPFNLFFHDVPDGKIWAESLRPHSYSTKLTPATGAAWKTIPSSYLICEDDHAFPLAYQKGMTAAAQAAGAKMDVESTTGSHSPYLSKPKVVADWVVGAVSMVQ